MKRQLKQVPWQVAVTLTFTDTALRSLTMTNELADPGLFVYKKFVMPVAVKMGFRVCGASTLVDGDPSERLHYHLLLHGQNARGRALTDPHPAHIGRLWLFGRADVKRITYLDGAVDYFLDNASRSRDGINYHGLSIMTRLLAEGTLRSKAVNDSTRRTL